MVGGDRYCFIFFHIVAPPFPLLYHEIACLSNDASLRNMMHLLRKYDVAPVGRNDAMFAIKCGEATHH